MVHQTRPSSLLQTPVIYLCQVYSVKIVAPQWISEAPHSARRAPVGKLADVGRSSGVVRRPVPPRRRHPRARRSEVVPGLVEVEVAVPRLMPALR